MKTWVLLLSLAVAIGFASTANAWEEPTSEQTAFAKICSTYKELLTYRGVQGWDLIEATRRTALQPCAAITSMITQMNAAQGGQRLR
ncbi:MAG TPA: hypothetical protein VN495_00650 [Candidatus Paceibacterota bacterium]|nr:hypothetical protein [Candidatus Paceibacterota bacterium]